MKKVFVILMVLTAFFVAGCTGCGEGASDVQNTADSTEVVVDSIAVQDTVQ